MQQYQSREIASAVQVETIEKYTVNDEIVLDATFVSQNTIRPGDWLVGSEAAVSKVMSNGQFNEAYVEAGEAEGNVDFSQLVTLAAEHGVEFTKSSLSVEQRAVVDAAK